MGASMPSRSNASASSGTVASDSAVWSIDASTCPAGHPGAHQLARAPVAAALGERGGHEVARAGEAGEGLAARAARDGQLVDLGEDAPGGRAGEVGAARRGGRRRERGGVLRAGGELRAGHVVGRFDRQPARLEQVAQLAAKVGVARGDHDGRAVLDRLARVRGAGERRDRARPDALGHEGGRRRAERRDEPLRRDEHRRAVAHPRADLADRGRQARARHGEHDEVDAGELDLAARS